MATPGGREALAVTSSGQGGDHPGRSPTLEEQLYGESYAFDFFQAVRLLERLDPGRRPVGRAGPLATEVVRFQAQLSLGFPPSAIHAIERAGSAGSAPRMVVAFMGLTGPSGILPRHYTEMLLRLEVEAKGPEKRAFRAWLDLFNHRLISLAYRAWEKYRFYLPYERGDASRGEPDPFTQSLFSLVGLGTPALRNRLQVSVRHQGDDEQRGQLLARLEDLTLLYFSGFLSQRVRNSGSLEALLRDYFGVPVEVQEFQGQWLRLDPANRSHTGKGLNNNQLGVSVVAGERVWDVQSKIRLRLGPLGYAKFMEFLPSRSPTPARKAFFLLGQLTRLYVGPELDFDVQLVLKKEDVPQCRLRRGPEGSQLGWNTWVRNRKLQRDAPDAVFKGEEITRVNAL